MVKLNLQLIEEVLPHRILSYFISAYNVLVIANRFDQASLRRARNDHVIFLNCI